MADIYMHKRLAHEFVRAYPTLKEDYVLCGSQGPDPYYYMVFSNQFTQARQIGDRLHDTNINTSFNAMINYVKTHYSDELYSYLVGYILHFVLDVNVHPYVYYHVGKYHKTKQKTAPMRGLHLRFERRIDACLIQEDTKKKPHAYKLEQALPFKHLPNSVASMMEHVVYETLDIARAGRLFQMSYRSMRRVIKRLVNDRFGFKLPILKMLDWFNRDRALFFRDMTFRKLSLDDFDYLNRDHRTWHHPITNAPSHKSVDDLYLDAYLEAEHIVKEVNRYLFDDEPIDFNALFKNRSFNSAMDADDERTMKYFHLFTDQMRDFTL